MVSFSILSAELGLSEVEHELIPEVLRRLDDFNWFLSGRSFARPER